MKSHPLLNTLNDKQREAVCAPIENLLILAGAGSGKTRVLTHRIAWLIQEEHVSPYSILAVTFTNKAAGEMRSRLESLLNMSTRGMWVGTFHSLAHRLLRTHWSEANLPQNFQILDSDDQYRMIRRVTKALNLDEENWSPKESQWYINNKKDEGLRPAHIDDHNDIHERTRIKIYDAYEAACERGGMVDFAELLLRAHELWRDNAALRAHYQERFKHILIDEFQDTNTIQYAWIRMLAGENNHVMMVGDDDQSIYGWRGAKVENIQRANQDFPNTKLICLEQNYRSTGNILAAANELISHNGGRLGKNLWTEDALGEPIYIYAAINETYEASFVLDRIQTLLNDGFARKDIAILYRSNAQSRVLEEAFIRTGIPYRVYGGLRFFERAEIKDAMSYLRLILNRHDDASFDRVVNLPTRGIGDRTLDAVRDNARDNQISLWQASMNVIEQSDLSARAKNALQIFLNLINELDEECETLALYEKAEHVIQRSGLLLHYKKEKGEKAQGRIENLQELVAACKQFVNDKEEEMPELVAFMTHASLEAGEQQADEFQDCVQLMSLHSAKGLEFPVVFITGVEEGLFPHKMSIEEPGRLEEERRLCYVGMTRARQQLYLTHAEVRRTYWAEEYHRPSRFLKEMPKECLQELRHTVSNTRAQFEPRSRGYSGQGYSSSSRSKGSGTQIKSGTGTFAKGGSASDTGFTLGQLVKHPHFGEGVILNYEGRGSHARLQIQFKKFGMKWLVLSHANLEAMP